MLLVLLFLAAIIAHPWLLFLAATMLGMLGRLAFAHIKDHLKLKVTKNSEVLLKDSIHYSADNYNKFINAHEMADIIPSMNRIVIIAGSGVLAAEGGMGSLLRMIEMLRKKQILVAVYIHPYAGYVSGQLMRLMHDYAIEPLDITPQQLQQRLQDWDLVWVIGANDVVNPDLSKNAHSPLYGIALVDVTKARFVCVMYLKQAIGASGQINTSWNAFHIYHWCGDITQELEQCRALIGS
jgi:NAD/NADP transhydrogenase beta subunit